MNILRSVDGLMIVCVGDDRKPRTSIPLLQRLILEKLDRELVQEKILVRLANRIKAMKDGPYIDIEKRVVEMGKMTGGWIKFEKKELEKKPRGKPKSAPDVIHQSD